MKKTVLALSALALVAAASSAFAGSIVNSKHDLASTNASYSTYIAGNTDQTCVFCHTPHNSRETRALWNRIGDATGAGAVANFKLYTSGVIAEAADWFASGTKGTMAAGSSSLLCMTCHDGVTSMNSLQNPPLTTAADNADLITGAANLGVNLTNDHPIGISYTKAKAANASGFIAAPLTTKVSLIGGDLVECASCHNVHDPGTVAAGTSPFLRSTNTSSALCVACHVK